MIQGVNPQAAQQHIDLVKIRLDSKKLPATEENILAEYEDVARQSGSTSIFSGIAEAIDKARLKNNLKRLKTPELDSSAYVSAAKAIIAIAKDRPELGPQTITALESVLKTPGISSFASASAAKAIKSIANNRPELGPQTKVTAVSSLVKGQINRQDNMDIAKIDTEKIRILFQQIGELDRVPKNYQYYRAEPEYDWWDGEANPDYPLAQARIKELKEELTLLVKNSQYLSLINSVLGRYYEQPVTPEIKAKIESELGMPLAKIADVAGTQAQYRIIHEGSGMLYKEGEDSGNLIMVNNGGISQERKNKDNVSPTGGIDIRNIKVGVSANSLPVELSGVGPDFFKNYNLKIVKMEEIGQ